MPSLRSSGRRLCALFRRLCTCDIACPFYRRAVLCSSSFNCPIPEVYVCSDARCSTGQPLTPGAVFHASTFGTCYKVTDSAFVPCVLPGTSEPPTPPPGSPAGAQCLPPNAVILPANLIGACVTDCNDPSCIPCVGYLWMRPCSCSGPGTLPPTAIALSELTIALQNNRCPVWSLGGVCAEPDFNRPWFSNLPPGTVLVNAGGASDGGCCACCGGGFPVGDPCRFPCAYQRWRPYTETFSCLGVFDRQEGELVTVCCGDERSVLYNVVGSFNRDEGGGHRRIASWFFRATFPGAWEAQLLDANYLNGVFLNHNRPPINASGTSDLKPCCVIPAIPGSHPINSLGFFPTTGVGSPASYIERLTRLTWMRQTTSCDPNTVATETTSAQLIPASGECAGDCADNTDLPGGGDRPSLPGGCENCDDGGL